MTSPSTGYVGMRKNTSDEDPLGEDCITVTVPAAHAVMVRIDIRGLSFILDSNDIKVFCSTCQIARSDFEESSTVWSMAESTFNTFLLNTTHVSFKVFLTDCRVTACFYLFFSFFSENTWPVKLAGGLWNCSVEHYASFRHHLACNLEEECEDGRDETADCPFSSPQCDGMIDLCDRCYTIATGLGEFVSDKTDINVRANEYCNSIGGKLSLPTCVKDLDAILLKKANISLANKQKSLTGLHTRDSSLSGMYTLSVVKEDKTVFHHSFNVCSSYHYKPKTPLYTYGTCMIYTECDELMCPFNRVFCEFQQNETKTVVRHLHISFAISSGISFLREHQSMAKCPDGHITHTFLLCGSSHYQICGQQPMSPCTFSDQSPDSHVKDSSGHHVLVVSTFTCNDQVTKLSYTLVCDFIPDCLDQSDETFCVHLPCVTQFRCTSGQCVSVDRVCDSIDHCYDHSDEKDCAYFKGFLIDQLWIPFPAVVYFDGLRRFLSFPMNSSEPCPDSHYRCPGDFNDCLPVYTRCNSMYDCIDHQDEDGCGEVTCPGFFRCRLSSMCVHSEHLCDGWPHCPKNDDELVCNITCPKNCLCQGHSFLCLQPFSAVRFPYLRYLDATGSGMTLSDVHSNALLIFVVLTYCSIDSLPKTRLLNLKLLDLGSNMLQHVNMTSFLGLENLQSLSLSDNPLTSLHTGSPAVLQHSALRSLDLSHTTLSVLDTAAALSLFPNLQKLNVTSTSLHTISAAGFQFNSLLTELYMDNSPIESFPPNVFQTLFKLRYVSTQNYKFCCSKILPHHFDDSNCIAPRDEISSCEDLLQSWTYRGFLWLAACLSLTGNAFCCCARLFAKRLASSSGFSVFVTNLTMADFLMGVYITIIGVADEQFRGQYLYKDDTWKHSVACKVAGFLSLLSSEVSALTIWLITLDRFIVLHFPFSTVRFDRLSAAVACLMAWLAGWVLAVLPLLPVTAYWEFYSQTGICVPLSVTKPEFKGRVYSFSVFIVFNSILFLIVSVGQALIYSTIQHNALKADSTKVSQDMTIARRLITIAVTDFMCWFPIGLCGLLALTGTAVPGEINVMLATFVLPLNSAINPFLYTFNTLAEKRRKRNEGALLEWLESHIDSVIDNSL